MIETHCLKNLLIFIQIIYKNIGIFGTRSTCCSEFNYLRKWGVTSRNWWIGYFGLLVIIQWLILPKKVMTKWYWVTIIYILLWYLIYHNAALPFTFTQRLVDTCMHNVWIYTSLSLYSFNEQFLESENLLMVLKKVL